MNTRIEYIFYWETGGYNAVYATSREEAEQKAQEMAEKFGWKIKEGSLHTAGEKESYILDCMYR